MGCMPIHFVVSRRSLTSVKCLIELNVDMNTKSKVSIILEIPVKYIPRVHSILDRPDRRA